MLDIYISSNMCIIHIYFFSLVPIGELVGEAMYDHVFEIEKLALQLDSLRPLFCASSTLSEKINKISMI